MSVFAVLDPAVRLAHDAVSALAAVVPTALAVVLFTALVRLALHPLARSAARGEKARMRLAPKVAELNRRHKGKPEKLQAALTELYREEKSSPFAGFLPMLVQIPFFSVMYRLFTTPNDLLGHTLAGVPLGLHLGEARTAASTPSSARCTRRSARSAGSASAGPGGPRPPRPHRPPRPGRPPCRARACCRTCRSARCCSPRSCRSRPACTC
ncbi:YidC/Oxa1 family membrane protein insertase [Kitasatospora arboriphila]